jgi:predicted alpha/beta hydrolase family esterase
MRYLEKIDCKVGNVVFVAGWFKLANLEDPDVEKIAKPWTETEMDYEKIKQNITKLTVFLSDNDPYGFSLKNSQIFKDKLNAQVIIEKGKGHFTGEEGVIELPEVLNCLT